MWKLIMNYKLNKGELKVNLNLIKNELDVN
jgi:hypothetical protein